MTAVKSLSSAKEEYAVASRRKGAFECLDVGKATGMDEDNRGLPSSIAIGGSSGSIGKGLWEVDEEGFSKSAQTSKLLFYVDFSTDFYALRRRGIRENTQKRSTIFKTPTRCQ